LPATHRAAASFGLYFSIATVEKTSELADRTTYRLQNYYTHCPFVQLTATFPLPTLKLHLRSPRSGWVSRRF
jgi:hypothetical protein